MAGYALKLIHDLLRLDIGPQGQRDESSDGLRLAAGASAGLAHAREQLEKVALLVLRDRYVEVAAAGLHETDFPAKDLGPPLRNDFDLLRADRLRLLLCFSG